jgi:5-carboxymethyl-2-hydroxymuconate isomerase
MPHIVVEYSANLEDHIDVGELLTSIHTAAASHALVSLAGLRTRAMKREQYVVANGDARNLFVAVIARLNGDRGQEPLLEIRDLLMVACSDSLSQIREEQPLALSVEVQAIDAAMRINDNSIRDHYEELR